ncbi:uncharacterized protein LOC132732573 isoform X2 [Ruditapes philippinarum]|uniref:uncharacterized protein LOC132732573 isoform X2 n=1 Tax=Ruditapes philippinarum TaxID=129788 RepID=UPI00295B0E44|nr:uncharacterized protein LOC132732573 isoform X2 [Ruditapes philippinarum]
MPKHRQQRGHTRDTLQQQVNNRRNTRTSVSTAMPPADRPVREPCAENEMDGQSGPPVDVDLHHLEANKDNTINTSWLEQKDTETGGCL